MLRNALIEQRRITQIIRKNNEEWDRNNNKLIIVDENNEEKLTYYYENLRIDFKGINATVKIHKSCKLTLTCIRAYSNTSIIINENTTTNGNLRIICTDISSVIINENCMISWNVTIHGADHHAIINSQNKILNFPKKTIIGNHTWIGHDTII